MRARWAAQLALSTLVLTTGCTEDGDPDTDATTNPDTTDATAATDATDATAATVAESSTGDETGTPTTGGGEAVTYAEIQAIWDSKCVNACHTPGGSASTNGPILDAGVSHANIVDKQAVTAALPLITSGDPDASYLWHKINGTQTDVGGGGSKMPIGLGLDEPTLALIEQWIVEGAKP